MSHKPPFIRSFKARNVAAITTALLSVGFAPCAHADRIWWDGSRDSENVAPGKLLSDNEGYWGETVFTGVEYSYEKPPTGPADYVANDAKRFGRRLLDGITRGNWYVPVGLSVQPLVTTFDFKRHCTFSEVDVATQSNKVSIKIECADEAAGPWRTVFERSLADSPDHQFHRVPLGKKDNAAAAGRYLRLTTKAEGVTFLNEVIVWGDAKVTAETPEEFKPVAPLPVADGISFPSIPGIQKSALSDAQFIEWRREIGAPAKAPAVWSAVPTWDSITHRPILPTAGQIAPSAPLVMARNETECAALALTNTSMLQPENGTVTLGQFKRVGAPAKNQKYTAAPVHGPSAQLRVAGAMPSRSFGVNLGPLLSPDNMPGTSLIRRYLTNGEGIKDFPRLTLSPAGSAVLWLSVTSNGTAPGTYEAQLTYTSTKGAKLHRNVRVEVLDVTLPKPPVWLQTWSGTTDMFPFVFGDRAARDVAYKQSLGATVWHGFPKPGTISAEARKRGRAIFYDYILPYEYVNKGYGNQIKPEEITDKDKAAIKAHVLAMVKEAKALGLSYDDWFGELWDEPSSSAPLYGAFARIIKEIDPNVRIYVNPLFWNGNGVDNDEAVYPKLKDWYNETIDISVPLELLMYDHPKSYKLFDAPRDVRAFYSVTTHVTKGEQAGHLERHRRFAWEAFRRGWNGWGFYAYYAPRGSAWNDFDSESADYLTVYPGPRGPIPTRLSESVREGWEEYSLLTLLRQRAAKEPKIKAELAAILKGYEAKQPIAALRLRALRAALGQR